eukprot:1302973-Rhodomonas_salina.1
MYAVARSSVTEALKMCDSIVIRSGVCESVLRETRAKSAYCTASPVSIAAGHLPMRRRTGC